MEEVGFDLFLSFIKHQFSAFFGHRFGKWKIEKK